MQARHFFAGALAAALAGTSIAQPAISADDTSCAKVKIDVERRMEIARSKGQMLLRRQLADELSALQTSCKQPSAEQVRAESIEKLEKDIQALRAKLVATEAQLRELKGEASR